MHAEIKMVLWWVVDRICPKTSDEGIAMGDWVSIHFLLPSCVKSLKLFLLRQRLTLQKEQLVLLRVKIAIWKPDMILSFSESCLTQTVLIQLYCYNIHT